MTKSLRLPSISLFLISAAIVSGCTSYSQTCADGVCTTESEGKTTYSGDATKIQAMKDQQRAELKLIEKLNAGAKRSENEPVRVALFYGGSGDAELQSLADKYNAMIYEAFSKYPDIQLIPGDEVNSAVEYAVNPLGAMKSEYVDQPEFKTDIKSFRKLWKNGLFYDVAVVWRMKAKLEYGFGGNSSGLAVAEVNLVEFEGKYCSIFKGKALRETALGKSTNSVAAAGIDKAGKTGKIALPANRNAEYDRPAIVGWASKIHAQIIQTIKPTLPALTALVEVEKNRVPASRPSGVDPKAAEKKLREWFSK